MKIIPLIAIAIMFLAACEKDKNEAGTGTTMQTDLSSNMSSARARVSHPFRITFSTTVDPNPNIPSTICTGDLPGFALAGLVLHGRATHLGRIKPAHSKFQHVSCNLSFATALLTAAITGQIAAANGDLIYFTGNDEINVLNLLTGVNAPGTITGLWTITGGTGIFACAAGSFAINGPVDFATSTISGTGIGTITY